MAAEALADAHARQGRAADDVALLEDLAARDPLRESVAVQLVRALYAAGRQADALAAYDRCCGALADELGVEPTPALRRVRAAVLAHDPLPGVGGTVLPTHLPPRNRSFVGRRGLLANVDATLDDDTRRPRAVALTGLGGVGKTELALELAHQRHRHGPGRLVDLRRRPRRHRHRARRAGRGAGDRAVRAPRGRPRGAVGRAGPHTGLAARLRQRGRARAARAVPARGAPRRRHHHLPQPGVAAHRPPRRDRAAGPWRVAGLRRHPHRGPARRGGHPGRAARRPPAGARAGVRLHRADADVAARLREPVPPSPQRAAAARGRGLRAHRGHHVGAGVRPAGGARTAGGGTAGDDRLPGPGRDLGRHAGPVRAGGAGAAGRAARAAAAVAGRPRGRDGAGAPAGAGRGACPHERGGALRPAGGRGARVRRPGHGIHAGRTRRPGRRRRAPRRPRAARRGARACSRTGWSRPWSRWPRGRRSGRSTRLPSTCCARRYGCPGQRSPRPSVAA